MHEHFFYCPYCAAEISMLVDISIPENTYIEDCGVCCNPIQVHVHFEEGKLVLFEASSIEQ